MEKTNKIVTYSKGFLIMSDRTKLTRVSCYLLAICSLTFTYGVASQTVSSKQSEYVAPRTEFDHPNLRGVWNFSSDTPLQRPERYKDREFLTPEEWARQHQQKLDRSEANEQAGRGLNNSPIGGYNQFWTENLAQFANLRTSLIIDPPDGRMPELQRDVLVARGGLGPDSPGERPVRFRVGGIAKDGPEDRGLSERCLMGFNSGPPFLPSSYNNNVQIFQTQNAVVILSEMIHDARIVKLDARPPLNETIQQWSGESRGYWEGDTLVVETRNFTNKTQSFRTAGTGNTLRLIEHFTRVDQDLVDYQFTIDDPITFIQPITVLVPMPRADGELYEYACHEGNYGMINMLSGARREEREAKSFNEN